MSKKLKFYKLNEWASDDESPYHIRYPYTMEKNKENKRIRNGVCLGWLNADELNSLYKVIPSITHNKLVKKTAIDFAYDQCGYFEDGKYKPELKPLYEFEIREFIKKELLKQKLKEL